MPAVFRMFGYRTYPMSADKKDPIIFKIKNVLQEEGLLKKRSIVHQLSGVATGTLDGWFDGETVSPINRTVQAVITSLGYTTEFVKVKDLDMDKELQKAADWYLKHDANGKKRPVKKRRLNGPRTRKS
jgi:hypothetical protein